jgi:hypothetical protein
VPLLLWRRTRIPALLLASLFHLTNARLFNIGIFPWFAIAATLLFMPPHWFRWLRMFGESPAQSAKSFWTANSPRLLAAIGIYCSVQLALPLRHWLYPGDPSWTEEGHTLAWHMRLREKDGTIAFFASDPDTGTSWQLTVADFLSERQYDQMKDNPQMILRFAHYLADTLRDEHPRAQIHVRSMMSLNNRTPQLLIDPTADLVRERVDLLASDWILPLVQRPYPAEAVPALLASWRYPGALLLVNITDEIYPLSDLTLQLGSQQLPGTAFGIYEMMPGECLLAYSAETELAQILVPCNEMGMRVLLPEAPDPALLRISSGSLQQQCPAPVCVIAWRAP